MTKPGRQGPDRRGFLAGAASSAMVAPAARAAAPAAARPALERRKFTSRAVEAAIARVRSQLGQGGQAGRLAAMFEACFANTLDTTVDFGTRDGRPDTFVVTGDIPAMWLRDSTAQVWPYVRLAKADPELRRMLAGVINRQTRSVLIDPYANAFNKGPTGSEFASDQTEMKPELHERKWEVDSLCWPVRLAHGYWQATADVSPFGPEWREAVRLTVRTFREQQRKTGRGPYHFQRVTGWNPDSVPGGGWGNPVRPVGLICSMFRPSDDACVFPFLVPSNAFAVVSLRQLADLAEATGDDAAFAADCRALAAEVEAALHQYAIAEHPTRGRVFAYEVDGYGDRLFMDDANAPSLLSLPYLGACSADDPVYAATRGLILSEDNPWFFRGRAAEGIGGPHTGADRIWPIGIAMRALTSRDDREILACLRMLISTDAGTGLMHEAFDKDDPTKFSRPWFAWANSLFGELVLELAERKPELLAQV